MIALKEHHISKENLVDGAATFRLIVDAEEKSKMCMQDFDVTTRNAIMATFLELKEYFRPYRDTCIAELNGKDALKEQ